MLTFFLLTATFQTAHAKSDKFYAGEIWKQDQIDTLFTEINKLASNEKTNNYLESSGIATQMVDFNWETSKIELQLAKLGVNKIDPNDAADMLILEELFHDEKNKSIYNKNSIQNTVPNPPDLSAIASLYTLYHYKGTYTVSGTTYDYAYIRVVDNKGYNKLYKNYEFDAAPRNATLSVAQAVLSHTFKYVFSTLISKTPVGIVIDWFMSTVFAGLSAYNAAFISGGDKPLYRINGHHTSSLTYYYIYHNNSWKLMGTGGEFTFERLGLAMFNYNGNPASDYATKQEWTSRTQLVWYDYVTAFHNNRHIPNYHNIQSFGSFKISGYNNTSFTITPVYINLPGYLI
jgi:hypothetical protein